MNNLLDITWTNNWPTTVDSLLHGEGWYVTKKRPKSNDPIDFQFLYLEIAEGELIYWDNEGTLIDPKDNEHTMISLKPVILVK